MSVLELGKVSICSHCGWEIKVVESSVTGNIIWIHTSEIMCKTPEPKKDQIESVAANDKQVDGDHYKTEIQPWDFIEANNLTFIEGNIIKYVARHRSKNGVRDLRKAQHYLEKLIEIEQSRELPDA